LQDLEKNAVSPSPIAKRAVKALVLVIAGLGALAAALMVAFLSTALSGLVTSSHALPVLVWGISCLATLAGLALVMKRLAWPWPAALGVLLLAGSFLLLPQNDCGAEPSARASC
jgi:polyferredoxin